MYAKRTLVGVGTESLLHRWVRPVLTLDINPMSFQKVSKWTMRGKKEKYDRERERTSRLNPSYIYEDILF